MHIGFRYHLASLVAVFFSLILGILIGGAMFQDDRLVEEQGQIIADLESKFGVMQENLTALVEKERIITEGWNEIRELVIGGRLRGHTVVLVTDTTKQQDWQRIKAVLEVSGAQYSEAQLSDLEDADLRSDVAVLTWVGQGLDNDSSKVFQSLIEQGIHITLLQSVGIGVPFPQLSPSLRIDTADTFIGEIALVQGLLHRITGHYGVQAGASSVIPNLGDTQ